MTKTFTTPVSHGLANPGEPKMISFGAIVDGPIAWVFEFGSLRFVWDLIIGAWNFHDFN
jgi:hypothetical protein